MTQNETSDPQESADPTAGQEVVENNGPEEVIDFREALENSDLLGNLEDILPPFASDENKRLDQLIKDKQQELKKIEAQLTDNNNRMTVMVEHMKNIQQEFSHCQGLYEARQREIESEEHMFQLAQRQNGRLNLEIKRLTSEIATMSSQIHTTQNDIFKVTNDIEKARQEMNLEKEELEDWLKIQNEKEEDAMALLKYSKEDDSRIKDISIQIEKLLQEVYEKKNILSSEVTETQVAQIELDRCTEMFRQLHAERQELIKRWEDAVRAMQKRDQDIQEGQEKYQQLVEEMEEKVALVNEKQRFLDERIQHNHEIEKKIEYSDRMVGKYRTEQQSAEESLRAFQDEVEALRNSLNKITMDLATRKIEINHMRVDLQEKQKKLTKEQALKEETTGNLRNVLDKTVSLEDKANKLQEIMHEEELQIKELDKNIKALKLLEFKKSQELFRIRKEEKDLSADITGSEATLRNWQTKIMRMDQELQKQQELIYTQDFQIQQLERKIRRAQGERTDEEQEVLNQKIQTLQGRLEEVTKKAKLLNNEWKQSQDDLRQAKIRLGSLQEQKKKLGQGLDDLNLYNDSASRQLTSMIRDKEELMVEENILRLELRRLRGFLNARADEVYSLEARQVQLQLALEERQKEIDIYKELLRVDIKNAEEERFSAKNELRERLGKVDKIRRKYEILVTRFAPEEGAEEHSQAYYVIKAAQKREELQREGDSLDTSIRKAEKEVRALENTLILMNTRNHKYRNSLRMPDVDSKEFKKKEILEQQSKTAMEKLIAKRREIMDLQQDIQKLDEALRLQNDTERNVTRQVEEMETRLNILMREIAEQEGKKVRTVSLLARQVKSLKNENSQEYEKCKGDIKLKEVKEIANYLITQLNNLATIQPEVSEIIQVALNSGTASLPNRRVTLVSPTNAKQQSSKNKRPGSSGSANKSPLSPASKTPAYIVNATFDGIIAESTNNNFPPNRPSSSHRTHTSSTVASRFAKESGNSGGAVLSKSYVLTSTATSSNAGNVWNNEPRTASGNGVSAPEKESTPKEKNNLINEVNESKTQV